MFANKQYIEFVNTCRDKGVDIVCASVLDTEGSTYRKKGASMLVSAAGEFIGVISGGCFEEDIVACAQGVLDKRVGKYIEHDLRMSDDNAETWGQGLGCNGLIKLWLEPFYHAAHYGALGMACDMAQRGQDATMVRSLKDSGVYAILSNGEIQCHPANHAIYRAIQAYRPESGTYFDSENALFFQTITAPYRLLILGAGPGCEPLVKMADTLGWHTTVCDTRESHMRHIESTDDKRVLESFADAKKVCEEGFDASVVMSHNFASDTVYLNTLLESDTAYIGIMGPKKRTRLMLSQLNSDDSKPLDPRIHNPVGLDLGGESPESIALSVIAEIEARRHQKTPVFLREREPGDQSPGSKLKSAKAD